MKKIIYMATVIFVFNIWSSFVFAQNSLQIPLGEKVEGINLGKPLAGRSVYKLTSELNIKNCWPDSVQWTGKELYLGLSAIKFSDLISGKGFKYNTDCNLPKGQVSANFDVYKAFLKNGKWKLINQKNLNTKESDAGLGISGKHMAFIRYLNSAKSWEIFLSKMKKNGRWKQPYEFSQNSKCKEDNPAIFGKGKKIIFESNRKDPEGTSCYSSDTMKLWYSQKQNGKWSTPILLPGDPNKKSKNTQPWVDEKNGYLYWTADKEGNSVKRIRFDGDQISGRAEFVLSPNLSALVDGTAHNKVVFVGEYSEVNGYAFISCASAKSGGDFMKKWTLKVNLCVIPPSG